MVTGNALFGLSYFSVLVARALEDAKLPIQWASEESSLLRPMGGGRINLTCSAISISRLWKAYPSATASMPKNGCYNIENCPLMDLTHAFLYNTPQLNTAFIHNIHKLLSQERIRTVTTSKVPQASAQSFEEELGALVDAFLQGNLAPKVFADLSQINDMPSRAGKCPPALLEDGLSPSIDVGWTARSLVNVGFEHISDLDLFDVSEVFGSEAAEEALAPFGSQSEEGAQVIGNVANGGEDLAQVVSRVEEELVRWSGRKDSVVENHRIGMRRKLPAA
ncbi:hypothetical protein DFH09DRAFT_1073097 [Mycena vulgaris]|nr:hypothetical protein DFH09DRAFT_1073097 [Mycena vulgaris]